MNRLTCSSGLAMRTIQIQSRVYLMCMLIYVNSVMDVDGKWNDFFDIGYTRALYSLCLSFVHMFFGITVLMSLFSKRTY